MYESALELVQSRDADIQNDKAILQVLSSDTSLSFPEAWDKIVHIRNGSIRFAACSSFLSEEFGEGEVHQAGDVKVIYVLRDTTISIPSKSDAKRQITVVFDSLSDLIGCPDEEKDVMTAAEQAADQYAALLRRRGSIPERVRMRLPRESKRWSDGMCRLYYFFVLYLSDVLHGRDNIEYWEDLRDGEREKRKDKSKKTWSDWNTQRRLVLFFKKQLYPKLQQFEFPVLVQINQRTYSVEKFFSMSGY